MLSLGSSFFYQENDKRSGYEAQCKQNRERVRKTNRNLLAKMGQLFQRLVIDNLNFENEGLSYLSTTSLDENSIG